MDDYVNDFVFIPLGLLEYERTARVMRNDNRRLEFFQAGPVQPFEEPEKYSARRIVDRVTPELLTRYALKLGVDISNPSFDSPDGSVLLFHPGPNYGKPQPLPKSWRGRDFKKSN